MWIPDVSTQPVEVPAIYLAANSPSTQLEEGATHKLGVCNAINSEADIRPIADAEIYLGNYMHQKFNFDAYPDLSPRTDTLVRIIEQPKHGRLMQAYPDTTDHHRNQYKYIPDVDYGDVDYFVLEVKASGISVQIYYTMLISLPTENTYTLGENGEKIDNCPKEHWKISAIPNASPTAISLNGTVINLPHITSV